MQDYKNETENMSIYNTSLLIQKKAINRLNRIECFFEEHKLVKNLLFISLNVLLLSLVYNFYCGYYIDTFNLNTSIVNSAILSIDYSLIWKLFVFALTILVMLFSLYISAYLVVCNHMIHFVLVNILSILDFLLIILFLTSLISADYVSDFIFISSKLLIDFLSAIIIWWIIVFLAFKVIMGFLFDKLSLQVIKFGDLCEKYKILIQRKTILFPGVLCARLIVISKSIRNKIKKIVSNHKNANNKYEGNPFLDIIFLREISANIDEINKDLKKVDESLIHKSQHSVLHTINETNNSIVIISWAVILVLVFIFIMFACSFPIVRDIGRTVAKLNRTYEIINIDQIDISNYHEISSNDYDCFVIVY